MGDPAFLGSAFGGQESWRHSLSRLVHSRMFRVHMDDSNIVPTFLASRNGAVKEKDTGYLLENWWLSWPRDLIVSTVPMGDLVPVLLYSHRIEMNRIAMNWNEIWTARQQANDNEKRVLGIISCAHACAKNTVEDDRLKHRRDSKE